MFPDAKSAMWIAQRLKLVLIFKIEFGDIGLERFSEKGYSCSAYRSSYLGTRTHTTKQGKELF